MFCCTSSKTAPIVIIAATVAAAAGFILGSSTPAATGAAMQAEHQRGQDHDEHTHSDDGMGGMPPEMQEMMQRWAEHAELTDNHKAMHDQAGTWLVKSQWWMGPGAPPEESMMIAQIRPIMGGRFMLEEMSGLMEQAPGQMVPWAGMAITGYDNHLEKNSFVWFDNTGTSLTTGHGEKTGRNTWTYEYDMYDAMMGAEVTRKNVITKKTANEHVFDMFTKMPDGSWFKNMRMTYTRDG